MFASIALGGGGVRGGIMIGGLAALEKHQALVFPKGIYGCSAGSIIATALAYNIPLHAIKLMFSTDFNLSRVIPSINLATITSFTTEKALFSMDAFGQSVLKAFDNQGIDLRNAVIEDTPQKLYIMAANLTTRRTVFLSGKVPILNAIKASCCLPFVFHPQILYNNVYIDGGFYVHNMHTIVPHDCLVFHISRSELSIHPERLKKMTISDYAATLYESFRSESQTNNVVWFRNDTISLMQELTDAQKNELYDQGFTQASRFFAKRLPEVLG
jgi:patatin-like phospholipase/acyl hydrolase